MAKTVINKSLGLADVFSISAGAMISSGIFILPGIAFGRIGPAVFLVYLLAGVCALVGALATIELATAMPLAGGIYFYTGRSLGPLAGTVSGLLNWSAISLKSAFAIFGMSEVIHQFTGINLLLCGVAITLLFLLINMIGTKEAAVAQIVMVVMLFAAMGTYILLGLPELRLTRFQPFFTNKQTVTALFTEAAFVFVAFGGLLDVASISEEVKNPRRNLPLGMISAVIAVTVIYVLTLIVTVGVMEPQHLTASLTPLADAARIYYGGIGFGVITFGALMAFVTTANAGVMAAARFPYAMGRDQLIPAFFSRTWGKRKMPLPALLVTGTVMIAVQFLPLEKLVSVASTVIMLSFILTNLAVIILRESRLQNYRPTFHVPFYPITQIAAIIIFGLLIIELGPEAVKIAMAIVCLGLILYFSFGRKIRQEFALVHLVGRMTGNGHVAHGLEKELREIVRNRDGIVADEFDRLIEQAQVKVLSDKINFRDLAAAVCRELDTDIAIDPEILAALLADREEQSSTVIMPEFALPHLTVEGYGIFTLIIVKCDPGIYFSAESPAVKIATFILTSRDKRNLYLKSLAAIVQVLQSGGFEKRWSLAKTPEQLRDLFLLSKRKRSI